MSWRTGRAVQQEEDPEEYEQDPGDENPEGEGEEEEPQGPPPRRDKESLAQVGRDMYIGMMSKSANTPDKSAVKNSFQATGQKFTDTLFPASNNSLIENWAAADYMKQREWKTFTWKRIGEIFSENIKVFNEISPNDILQGSLGDCYFLSTLSAMAEFPKRIEKLFETPDYEPSGCYKVKIMDMGLWKEYVMDDFFPVRPDGKVAFSGPKEEKGVAELWVVLLEKAWAKRFGCYYDIEAGFTNECLTDLTGAPCDVVNTDDSEIWEKVNTANKSDFIITAGSGGTEEGQDLVTSMGLVGLHAYAVIDAQTVQTSSGPENILMIRNPWGEMEWKGDWGDSSSKWTPAIKKKLGWSPKDDGSFWMGLSDFCQYFTDVTICRVHDDYDQTAVQVNQAPGKFNVTQLTIRKPGTVYLIVCQPDTRVFQDDPAYQYSPVRIILAKLNPNNSLEFIAGRANANNRDVWDQYELEPGEYLAYTEISWDGAFTTLHGISIYAHHKLGLKSVTSTNQDFLEKVYNLSFASAQSSPKPLAPGVNFYSVDRTGFNDGRFTEGFAIDLFENNTDAPAEISVMHKVFENFEVLPPYQGDTYSLTVKPGTQVSVVKKQLDLLESTSQAVVPVIKKRKR